MTFLSTHVTTFFRPWWVRARLWVALASGCLCWAPLPVWAAPAVCAPATASAMLLNYGVISSFDFNQAPPWDAKRRFSVSFALNCSVAGTVSLQIQCAPNSARDDSTDGCDEDGTGLAIHLYNNAGTLLSWGKQVNGVRTIKSTLNVLAGANAVNYQIVLAGITGTALPSPGAVLSKTVSFRFTY
jgi:hypothetical protein